MPGASVGIVREDRLAWSAGIGFADYGTGDHPDAHTLYRIASITKTLTATAVVQLRDEGRLRLDDPLVVHVPEFAAATNPHGPIEDVTVRRLLTHRSGLQSEPPVLDPRLPTFVRPDELLSMLDRVRVSIPPGSAFKYSNLGFELLGEIVRRLSGRALPVYLSEQITAPLGMGVTVYEPDEALVARCAVGYDARGHEDRCQVSRGIDSLAMVGSAGLWSSVDDLARWVAQQMRRDEQATRGPGQVLQGGSLREMHQPQVLNNAAWSEANGLAWYVTREDGVCWVGHSGTMFGFTTNISFEPDEGLGAIVLLNGVGPADKLARALAMDVLPSHRDARVVSEAAAAPPQPTPPGWNALLGLYRDAAFAWDVAVEYRSNDLVCVIPDSQDGPHRLDPTADPLVFVVHGGRHAGEPAQFLQGPDGRVDGLNLGGNPLTRLFPAAN